MVIENSKPTISIRCTTLFGWAIPIYILFSYFNYRENISLNIGILLLFSLAGVALAVPGVLQVIQLRKKVESKILNIILMLLVGVAIIALMELKRHGIFVWNELYFTAPVLLFSLVTYSGCFFAEDRNFVRVYLALDGYYYVRD